jgi:predicted phosphoribosyltransferase
MSVILQNRRQAGRLLASKLASHANRPEVLVLALPRGGVPVAFEIATRLNLPLDVCLVRKLGVPGRRELAMGAIAAGGTKIINEAVVEEFHISPEAFQRVVEEEQQELTRRERLYRGNCPPAAVPGRTIILVDDGIATGATLKAAIAVLRQQQPKAIVVAVPVASPTVCEELQEEVEQVICLSQPDSLHSISLWYEDFSQTTDAEVEGLLREGRGGEGERGRGGAGGAGGAGGE